MAYLPLAGSDLYYEVEGDGLPVLLIHGLALDTRMWDDQVPALRAVSRVIRLDLRGFGRSTRDPAIEYTNAADIWALLDQLGVDEVVLVGLSMGGRVALETLLAAPHRVRALVVIDAVLDGVPWDGEAARGMDAIGEGIAAGGLSAGKAAWLQHSFFIPAGRNPAVAARLAEMVEDYGGANFLGSDPHGPHPAVLEALPEISTPTTVVVGELDVPCFLEMADVLASQIPDARKIVIPDTGHMANMEAPTQVTELLLDVVRAAAAAG